MKKKSKQRRRKIISCLCWRHMKIKAKFDTASNWQNATGSVDDRNGWKSTREGKLISKLLTYFPHIPTFPLAPFNAYIVSQFASLSNYIAFFLTTLKSGPRIYISRDVSSVRLYLCEWIFVFSCIFQCHSIFLIGLNESCFLDILIPEKEF